MSVLKSVIAVRRALYGPAVVRVAKLKEEKWQWLKDKIEAKLECDNKKC